EPVDRSSIRGQIRPGRPEINLVRVISVAGKQKSSCAIEQGDRILRVAWRAQHLDRSIAQLDSLVVADMARDVPLGSLVFAARDSLRQRAADMILVERRTCVLGKRCVDLSA